MQEKLKILMLEDVAADAELEERALRKSGLVFDLRLVDNQEEFEKALDEFVPDVILSDHQLPSFNSVQALSIVLERRLDIPFILVTATISEEFAVDMMNRGAADYILKDRLQRLPMAVENAVEKWRSKKESEKFLSDVVAREAMLSEAEKIAHVGSFRIDLQNKEVKWSEEATRIFGYASTGTSPSLEDFFSRVHPDDRQRIRETMEYAQKNRRMVSMDFKLKMDDGEIKFIRSELVINRDEQGEPVTISGFHQDVTESKQNELLWLTLLKAIPDAVINVNTRGEIIFANKKAGELFGYHTMEMIGQPIEMVLPENLQEKDSPVKISGFKNPAIDFAVQETRSIMALKKDGTLAEVDINLGAVETPNGLITIAILRDVTVVRKIERQVQANEKKFRALIEHNADMITLTSQNGNILYISPSFTKLLGYTAQECEQKHSFDFFHPEDANDIQTVILQASQNPGEAFYCKYRIQHKNGTFRWCEGTITDLLNDPNVEAIVTNFRDITERRNTEKEKEKITSDLIRQNKDLEQFAYIVSHNLRAPVANIKGLANSMQYSNNEKEKTFIINGISTAVNKLDEIIIDLNQILNNTRANSEKREMVSLSKLIADIETSIADLINKSDAIIETDFSEVDSMLTQKSYLLSIFFNLISNSIKYRKEDEDPVISIKSYKKEDSIVIVLEDNGIGIDMEKYGEHIFGLYKRFHYHIEGKGMGLFMVKTQVEALGGQISINSTVDEGTTFTITFQV